MYLDVNNYDKLIYELILCKPNDKRTELAYIHYTNLDYAPRFKDITQLTFTINYFESVPTGSVINQNFDKILGNYLIKLNIKINNGISDEIVTTQFFTIVNPSSFGVDKDYKELVCFSLEHKLTKRKLRGYKKVSYLYDTNGDNGLLNYIVSQLSDAWTIGNIDESLLGLQRSFNYASVSFIQVFRDIERIFNTVVDFDTVNMKININLLNNTGENKDCFISQDNYMTKFSQSEKHQDIITKLYCYGNNNLGIASKNITGQNYLIDLSYYRTSEYMDDDLLQSWDNYDAVLESHKGEFTNYLSQLTTLNSFLLSKQSELASLNVTLYQYQDNMNISIKEGSALGHNYAYWYNLYLTQQNLINTKKNEIINVQNSITSVNNSIIVLNNQVSLENNFTPEQLKLMNKYFISEDEMNISEIEDAQTLYEENVYQLNKKKIPVIDIELDLVDLLSISVAKKDWKKIKIGDFINIDYKRYNIDCLPIRLVAYTHNPVSNKLTLSFNNQDEFNDDYYYNQKIFNKNAQTTETVEIERPNYNLFVDEQGNLLYNGQPINSIDTPITLPDGSVIGDNGLVMSDSPTANSQMRILGDRILFTENNWADVSVGIDGSGIHAINIDGVNISGSNITGTTITSNSVINIATDVNVGNQINLGTITSKDTDKSINFYNNGSDSVKLSLLSDGTLELANTENNPSKYSNIYIHTLYSGLEITNDLEIYSTRDINISGGRFLTLSSVNSTVIGGNVCIANSGETLAFFGGSPITKKTATRLPSDATLSNVISTLNGVIGILGQDNYNLITVYG